jgi:glutamate synthase domain-containing protein 3
MATKIRKQVYIEPRQELLLKEIAQKTGISEAEIIRQAIDQHIAYTGSPKNNLETWEEEKAFIESTKKQVALPGGRDWKREDLYER